MSFKLIQLMGLCLAAGALLSTNPAASLGLFIAGIAAGLQKWD